MGGAETVGADGTAAEAAAAAEMAAAAGMAAAVEMAAAAEEEMVVAGVETAVVGAEIEMGA